MSNEFNFYISVGIKYLRKSHFETVRSSFGRNFFGEIGLILLYQSL